MMATHDRPTPERLYSMRRVAAGDYLLPSNDLKVLWRIHSYVDGKIHGLEVGYQARTFWRACWLPYDEAAHLIETGELPDPWDFTITGHRHVWREADWFLPTRQAAIDCALRHDAKRIAGAE